MVISSTGNVGIGTATPSNMLHVQGGIQSSGAGQPPAGNGLVISSESTYDRVQPFNSRYLAINPLDNSVGIATTTPGLLLELKGP